MAQFSSIGVQSVPAFKRGEDFDRWLKALNFYFGAAGITDVNQKKCMLLHTLGMEVQDIFETLPAVQGQADDYMEACERLKKYFGDVIGRRTFSN